MSQRGRFSEPLHPGWGRKSGSGRATESHRIRPGCSQNRPRHFTALVEGHRAISKAASRLPVLIFGSAQHLTGGDAHPSTGQGRPPNAGRPPADAAKLKLGASSRAHSVNERFRAASAFAASSTPTQKLMAPASPCELLSKARSPTASRLSFAPPTPSLAHHNPPPLPHRKALGTRPGPASHFTPPTQASPSPAPGGCEGPEGPRSLKPAHQPGDARNARAGAPPWGPRCKAAAGQGSRRERPGVADGRACGWPTGGLRRGSGREGRSGQATGGRSHVGAPGRPKSPSFFQRTVGEGVRGGRLQWATGPDGMPGRLSMAGRPGNLLRADALSESQPPDLPPITWHRP